MNKIYDIEEWSDLPFLNIDNVYLFSADFYNDSRCEIVLPFLAIPMCYHNV